jgi:uncharacterized iron-regulated membrane protein
MSRHPVVRAANLWTRRVHRWGAVGVALPLVVIITTGLLLQVKKQVPWVQPPTRQGSTGGPMVGLEQILTAARTAPAAAIDGWDDVDRLDLRPADGIVKVHARNRWEVQVDLGTGGVLQARYRRSDLIESLHDGSFFHDRAKLLVFLPAGVLLLMLWCTGVYLWVLPVWSRRAGRRRRSARSSARGTR